MNLRSRFRCVLLGIVIFFFKGSLACVFHTQDGHGQEVEGVRFIRVREDTALGSEILLIHAYPRHSASVRGMERSNDHKYFSIKEINTTTIQVVLEKSLDDLVDRDVPHNLLKFRLFCTGGRNDETAYISITVYVEDINDHAPVFLHEPYIVEVDESTPPGTIIFQGIEAFDRDKPNTPNSDVQISLIERDHYPGGPYFALESPHRPLLILKRPLDYDSGLREFSIPVIASDRGTPVKKSNTTLRIVVKDHDDLPPKFSEGVYRTKINEFYPMTGKTIHVPLHFTPPIRAFDQDSLNASLIYDIISGNERRLFKVNPITGQLYLEKEIDLEEESLPGNTFVLQIEARQKDSALKRALARVEIEVLDLNDNAPEFEVELYNISIVENLPSGFSVLQVNAMDKDQGENAEFFYNLMEEVPSGAFLIDARTGWITVREQALLDREARPSISMRVQAVERIPPYDTDRQNDAGTVEVEITLLDSNDNTPQFENGNLYEFKVNVNAVVGTMIGKVLAKDPDEGRNGMILYELQRPKGSGYIPFRLDSQTGALYVAGPLRKGRIALFVEASDQPTNLSERRFSLSVVTIEVHAEFDEDSVDFVGAPYEFWVGADVGVGTSVGQVRTTVDYEGDGEVMYDLLHSYAEGVPFAIEERSGVVTVIRDLEDFDRIVYYFEAVANFEFSNKQKGRLERRISKSEKHITQSGEILEIDEGIVADSEDVLVTNVTIHVVSPDDERGILMRNSNINPIEFHIKENLPGTLIGRLLYKNNRKNIEKFTNLKDLVGLSSKDDNIRQNRHINSKFRRNSTSFQVSSFMDTRKRIVRSAQNSSMVTYVTPMALISDSPTTINPAVRSFGAYSTRRMSTWRPKVVKETTTRRIVITDDLIESSTSLTKRKITRNNTADVSEAAKEKRRKNEKPVGLRFIIANQQDVINKITIMDDGTIMTLSGLDRETRDTYRLTVIAEYSKGFVSGAGIYQVNIYVDDVNDNPPVFDAQAYSGIIYENSKIGSEVVLNKPIRVSDADSGRNAEFTVNLAGEGRDIFAVEFVNNSHEFSNNSFPLFESQDRLDVEKGFLTMQMILFNPNSSQTNEPYYRLKFVGAKTLDREREQFYNLNLIARDTGGLMTTVKLSILIADMNDNPPVFERIAIFKESGVDILQNAEDFEIYFVDKPEKNINSEKLLIEGTPRFNNGTQGDRQRSRRAYLRKSRARFSRKLKAPPVFSVMEDTLVGIPILKLTAVDDDLEKNAQVFYEIASESMSATKKSGNRPKSLSFFSIDRISGEIKVNHPLKANTDVSLNVTARDVGGLSDTMQLRFSVVDVNNHPPVFKKSWYNFDLQEGVYYDQSIDRIEATDEDYGQNANITYKISSQTSIPFQISAKTGVLKVDGDLDRELVAQYEFFVMAVDNAEHSQRLTGSVEVEINILDVNDNAPEFIGFDDVLMPKQNDVIEETGRKLIAVENLNKMQFLSKIPVYKAYLNRNTIPGTFVKQITAIDKDYAGNGNGLVMFSLLHHRMPHLFEIDSRDGIITTISRFNRYNGYEHVNLTIVASDLGSPSKSSTAMLLVNLQGEHVHDADEMDNIFPHKYYEVEVSENNIFPLQLIKINVSAPFAKESFKWTLVPEVEEEGYHIFIIDSKNGTVSVIQSLDREEKDHYRLKVRADLVAREGRAFPTITYPVGGNRIHGLLDNEVRIVVRVTDVNDNPPKFKGNGRPIVTVIPNSANFGFEVMQVEAVDIDAGINAEIRYKLLNEPSRLFGIDEKTGKIRVLGSVREDQRVYGFDVKATDRAGDDSGRSSIVNVFVYVLDENRQVRLVVSGKPVEVEKEVDLLTDGLSEATGMDVRVRLLEPHTGTSEPATDAYIYAVDKKANTIVDMEDLQAMISALDIKELSMSPSSQILELSELGKRRSHTASKLPTAGMSGTELISIILAIIVFAGGLATSLCVICVRYKRRQTIPPSETGLAYSIARVSSTLGTGRSKNTNASNSSPGSKRSFHDDLGHRQRTKIFPTSMKTTKGILTHYDDRPREYIDVPLPKSVMNPSLSLMDHDTACLRFNQIHSSSSQPLQDTSVQSHHSSGHDSGVGFIERSDTPDNLLRMLRGRSGKAKCACNRMQDAGKCSRRDVDASNACCGGGESSDSYEDSLKNSDLNRAQQKLPTGPLAATINNTRDGFRRSIRNHRSKRGMRHSFSGVRDDLTQQSPRVMRPRVNSFRNSMTDLEQRLHNLEQSFREPFLLNNSRT